MSNKKKRVFVGMSGGVDSSVAAFLLKKDGYDVTGVFINGFNVDGCSERDAEDARRTADHIGIPFYVLDAREDYFEHVVQYMIEGYKNGITPNPDVMCNKEIKFGVFLDKALKLGADYVATGHYVRKVSVETHRVSKHSSDALHTTLSAPQLRQESETELASPARVAFSQNHFSLFEGKDKNKDQSYFLWTLTQEQLKHCLFPIGEYTKPEIRKIAQDAGLPTADKKDSQGVCFLGKVKLPDFLKEYIEPKKGDVLDTDGRKIGEHEGVQFYTIGQRHLNVNFQFPISNFQKNSKQGNSKHRDRMPYYIVKKDAETNTLIVAEGDDHPALFRGNVFLADVHFTRNSSFEIKSSKSGIPVLVRVRYRQRLCDATLIHEEKRWNLVFGTPQKFIAPGQSTVFYSPEIDENGTHELLGGGVILE